MNLCVFFYLFLERKEVVPFLRETSPIFQLKEEFNLVGFTVARNDTTVYEDPEGTWLLTFEGEEFVAALKLHCGTVEILDTVIANTLKALEYISVPNYKPAIFKKCHALFGARWTNTLGWFFLTHLERFYAQYSILKSREVAMGYLESGLVYEIKQAKGELYYDFDIESPWFERVNPKLRYPDKQMLELICGDKIYLSSRPLRGIIDTTTDRLDEANELYFTLIGNRAKRLESMDEISRFLSRLIVRFVEITKVDKQGTSNELRRIRFTGESIPYLKGMDGSQFKFDNIYDRTVGPLIIRYPSVDSSFDIRWVIGESKIKININDPWPIPLNENIYQAQLRRAIEYGVSHYGSKIGVVKRVDHQPCFIPSEVHVDEVKIKSLAHHTRITYELERNVEKRHFVADLRRVGPFMSECYRSEIQNIEANFRGINDARSFGKLFMTFLRFFYKFDSIATSFSSFDSLSGDNSVTNMVVAVFRMPPTEIKKSATFKCFLKFEVEEIERGRFRREIKSGGSSIQRLCEILKPRDEPFWRCYIVFME